ncbi:MAG: ATP-binding cassette domain-containing protein [Candidatus Aegiribacteria sp.]|nr:ATP-binding cassette domain-containing protein [Candidatus Aegiribacteria sp.]
MNTALLAANLSYSYGDLKAVRGISFHLRPGEILGFLGPNGAGKSTTIKMLTGLLTPDTGSIHLLGNEMSRDNPEAQARIGVCFEEKNLYLNMTGRENLKFFSRLFGIKNFDTDALLRKVDLAHRADDRVSKYSKGMRQRLMMARAIINRPDVLFLDEPTEGLDPVSSRTIRNIIMEQAERGAAVLLTTHDMWEADELSDRVAFLNEGTLFAVDTPDNLKMKYGKRSVKVRLGSGSHVREETIELAAADAGDRIRELINSDNVMTIHTEEATLEDIFIEITGRGLDV